MRVLNKFTATLCLFSLSAVIESGALAQQASPTQQSTVAQHAPEPASGKPAEGVPAKPADGWRAVSTRQPGEVLKIKLTNGSVIKGKFKSANDAGLTLALKNNEVNLRCDEIASVAVLGKRSAGKSALIGMAVGGGVGAGAGAGFGAAQGNNFLFSRGQTAALGAAFFGGIGVVAGGLIGFATGHASYKETIIYQAPGK